MEERTAKHHALLRINCSNFQQAGLFYYIGFVYDEIRHIIYLVWWRQKNPFRRNYQLLLFVSS